MGGREGKLAAPKHTLLRRGEIMQVEIILLNVRLLCLSCEILRRNVAFKKFI